MPRVRFEYEKADGGVGSFDMQDLCLRLMGKNPERIADLNRKFPEGSKPLTATFVNMFDNVSCWENVEAAKYCFNELLSLSECFQCVLTTADAIEPDGDLTVNMQHRSYNELMFALFHMRNLFHATECTNKPSSVGGPPDKPVYLDIYDAVQEGWTFPAAYVARMMHGNHSGVLFSHLGMNDGSCWSYKGTPASHMWKWATGQLYDGLEFKQLSFADHVRKRKGYPHNIVNLLSPGAEQGETSLYTFYEKLYSLMQGRSAPVVKRDLFGNAFTVNEGVAEEEPETWAELLPKAKELYIQTFGEF